MNRRLKISTFLFYGVTGLMILCTVVSFIGALSWINKPFAGFLIYPFPHVGSFGSRDWPGYAAGLKYMDRIVAVDGQPLEEGADLVKMLAKQKPGTPVHYDIESKGVIRKATIPVHAFSLMDFISVFLAPYLFGVAIYVLGFIVFVLKPHIRSSWVFIIMCLAIGTYAGTGFEMQSTFFTVYFHYLIIPLVPAAMFHLCTVFPDKKKIISRYPALEYVIYLPAFLIAVSYEIFLFTYNKGFTSSWIPHPSTITPLNRIFTLACVVALIVLLVHSVFRATSSTARQRAWMILFGMTVAFLPTVSIQAIVSLLKVTFPWNLLVFFVFFFPASIAYSIVRHNLFDADEIIKRTVGYFVVTAIVVGAYALVSLSFNVLLGQYQLAQSRAFPILFTLGVILVFNPLRNRIQALVDRVFFRKEYDSGAILEKIGDAMTSLLDLPQILKRLTQTFMEDMFINTSSVMLLTPAGTEYQVFLADGERKQEIEKVALDRKNPLMEIIEGEKRELTKYDVLEDPKYRSVSEKCVTNFESLHSSLMVPLVYQDQVIGLMNLGEKKSGKSYNREDIELLRTLAHQGAVAIENARLFQENLEKQRMEEELNIARDLQASMLPATCPQIAGFEIAASSTPAREVGGDFFDFIEIGENRVGLVVGDVTGKSVSGALVMSASRSVFRMLSEDELTVGESMMRANRRLKQDIKSGMFVALLYVVLDGQDKSLNLCSAGQTQPVHLAAKTGDALLVETEGDTFPLGILDESNYEETKLQLESGDKVVFYTDGIVEAMNTQEEMYGFERLQQVIQAAKSMDADALLKEILNSVNEFAGGAAQHDDITVIVVNVE